MGKALAAPAPGPYSAAVTCERPASLPPWVADVFWWCTLPPEPAFDPGVSVEWGHSLFRGAGVSEEAPGQLRLWLHAGGQHNAPKMMQIADRQDVVMVAPQADPPNCRDWWTQTNCDGQGWRNAAVLRIQAALDVAWAMLWHVIDLKQGFEVHAPAGPVGSLGSSGAWALMTGALPGWAHLCAAIHTTTGWTRTSNLRSIQGGSVQDWAAYDVTAVPFTDVYMSACVGIRDLTTVHDPAVVAWMDSVKAPGVVIQYDGGHGVPADVVPAYQPVRRDRPVIAWINSSGDTPATDGAGNMIPCARRDGFAVDTASILQLEGITEIPVRYLRRTGRSGGVPDLPVSVSVDAVVYRAVPSGAVVEWSYLSQFGTVVADAFGRVTVPLIMGSSALFAPLRLEF